MIALRQIARLSRDRNFLIRTSLGIVAMSSILAIALPFMLGSRGPSLRNLSEAELWSFFESREPRNFEQWLMRIRTGGVPLYHADLVDFRIIKREVKPVQTPDWESQVAETPIIEPLYRGMRLGEWEEAVAELSRLPGGTRYRAEFLGDLHIIQDDLDEALRYYLKEANAFPDEVYSHRSAVVAAWRLEDFAQVDALLNQTEFRQHFGPSELIDIYADAQDFAKLGLSILQYEWSRIYSPYLIPAAFTAAIWYFILTSFWQFSRTRLIASLVAFLLGIFSSVLTLFAVIVQERIQGFNHDPASSELAQLIYCISGIGLREETLKLLCFVPLAIWVARRKSSVEALVLASLVGLGFAFQENLEYFRNGLSDHVALIRLLTANVLHFALTGIAGYYTYRMIVRKFRGWEEFLAAFIAAVVLHGLYDAVLFIPSWASYSIFSIILVAIISYQCFDPLRSCMDFYDLNKRVSPLGIFILGSVALTCIVLISSAASESIQTAFSDFAAALGSMIPLAFAYISRFRDL